MNSTIECLVPFKHHPDAKQLMALAHTLQKGLLSLPILACPCDFCDAISSLDPESLHKLLNSALTAVSAECKLRAQQLSAIKANICGYYLAPDASIFHVAAECPAVGTPLGPYNALIAFREILFASTSLGHVFSKWCDARHIYSWFSVRLSTINHFLDAFAEDIETWVSSANTGYTPSSLSAKWSNAPITALRVCSRGSSVPIFASGPLLPASHRSPIIPKLRSLLSVYTPKTWSVNWGYVRHVFRSVIGRGHTKYHCLVMPSDTVVTRKIHLISGLTKTHTHRLAEDLHTRDLFPGYKSDSRFALWVISQSPLPPHIRQRAMTVLHPLCKTASGSTSPQAELIRSRTYQNVMQRKEEGARRKHSTRHILSTTQNYRFTSQLYYAFPFWYPCPLILFFLYPYTEARSGETACTNGSGILKLWRYSPL